MRSPDVPRRRVRTTRGRVGLLVAAVVIFILIISLRGIAGFYTDFLWFQELQLTSVWRGVLGAKVGLGALFTLIFFVLMWVNLAIADRIDQIARHHMAVAFNAGVLAAAPEQSTLRWVFGDAGPCPDCDDNALAGPTAKGDSYPTGQRHPPAHAGCGCLLIAVPG